MSKLIFWTNPMSRGRTVRWMLEEVGAEYETRNVGLRCDSDGQTEDFFAANPMGKVPTIMHGATVVTESAAICAYLADAFPDAGLAPPADSPERGTYYRWLFFAAGPAEQAVTYQQMIGAPSSEAEPTLGFGSLARVTDTLEGLLEGRETILDSGFSAADLYMSALLGFLLGTGGLEKRPAFETYIGRHMARPAAIRANELDGPIPGSGG